ncbi:MAG TPA: hypothetical protein VK982_04665 [Bacteroidales bacterium]|nr:hypothetical protein [Bacteroidales bacterium]
MVRCLIIVTFFFLFVFELNSQQTNWEVLHKSILETNQKGKGPEFEIRFYEGHEIYYPLMAVWIEDMEDNYIQTLYVAESIAKGVFNYGEIRDNRWVNGVKRRPAALPYWGHQRGIQASDGFYLPTPENPIADAYTGATPTTGFILKTKADSLLPVKFRILLEINQSWDWNKYWTNNKFPGDEYYKTSAQPAVIYATDIDLNAEKEIYEMRPVGHSHYSGKDGNLYPDLSTLTTALQIVDKIMVKIKH